MLRREPINAIARLVFVIPSKKDPKKLNMFELSNHITERMNKNNYLVNKQKCKEKIIQH